MADQPRGCLGYTRDGTIASFAPGVEPPGGRAVITREENPVAYPDEIARSNGHDRFEDDRGVITDLLGQVDAVTEITTKAGKIRGNHVHARTTQWTYVVSGRLEFAWTEDDGKHTAIYESGALVTESAGVPHAWRALEDTRVLVFTRGPRSGQAYETDTARLDPRYRLL